MLLGFLSPEFENHRADPRDFRYVTGEDRVSATGSGQVSTLCQVAQQAAVSSTHAPNTITDAAPNLQPTQLEWGFIRLAINYKVPNFNAFKILFKKCRSQT